MLFCFPSNLPVLPITVLLITIAINAVALEQIVAGNTLYGITVHNGTQTALVTSKDDGTLILVDLKAKQVVKTIPVGKTPGGPAVNEKTNVAIVINEEAHTVTLVDLTTGSVTATIPVGQLPQCAGVDPEHNIAAVGNLGSGTVSVIDLAAAKVIQTISVGNGPFCMHGGINPKTQTAVVATSGYIVNVTEDKVFSFVGAAWTNTPPVKVEHSRDGAAPSATARTSAWAFVVSGVVSDTPGGIVPVRNLTTGAVARSAIDPSTGHFSAAWADLNRQSVVQVGDTLEFDFTDGAGELIGRVRRHLWMDDIQNAYLRLTLRPEELLPTQTRLMQNYPNPFNPETWIPFALAEGAPVTITIYDTAGRLVRRFNLGQKPAGNYTSRDRTLYWDGRNDAGERVSSGAYFYQLQAGEFSATRKRVILK